MWKIHHVCICMYVHAFHMYIVHTENTCQVFQINHLPKVKRYRISAYTSEYAIPNLSPHKIPAINVDR